MQMSVCIYWCAEARLRQVNEQCGGRFGPVMSQYVALWRSGSLTDARPALAGLLVLAANGQRPVWSILYDQEPVSVEVFCFVFYIIGAYIMLRWHL